jgi:hypothetical protein
LDILKQSEPESKTGLYFVDFISVFTAEACGTRSTQPLAVARFSSPESHDDSPHSKTSTENPAIWGCYKSHEIPTLDSWPDENQGSPFWAFGPAHITDVETVRS